MSEQDYILHELNIMREACRQLKITPEEWIRRYAITYHETHFELVIKQNPPCYE